MSDTIAMLRSLRSSIDVAIDEASAPQPSVVEAATSMGRIEAIATQLKDLVTPPAATNSELLLLPYKVLAVRIGLEMGVFDRISSHTSFTFLSETTKADTQLLLRILRVLTSMGYLTHEEDGTYSATPLSENLLTLAMRSWVSVGAQDLWDLHRSFSSFLERGQWGNPDDPAYTLSHYVYGKSFWAYIKADPEIKQRFDAAMIIQDQFPPWMQPDFNFTSQIPKLETSPNAVTIVDIGGGKGQVLESIRSAHPRLPGRMIIQDLPETISNIDHDKLAALKIEAVAYDFFTPQPIKGAKYYHMRRVLHDWPDSACVKILGRIREAMLSSAGYSRLLLHESVLPDRDVGLREALVDMAMMELASGMERSRSQWEDLLSKVGFKIVTVHEAKVGVSCIIEAEVVTE